MNMMLSVNIILNNEVDKIMEKKIIMRRDKIKDTHTQEVYRCIVNNNQGAFYSNINETINKEKELLCSKEARKKMQSFVSVLDKVKYILTIKDTDLSTLEAVASYFNLEPDYVLKMITNSKDTEKELLNSGMEYLTVEEASAIGIDIDKTLTFRYAGLEKYTGKSNKSMVVVFNKRAILDLAMMLYNNDVALQVRISLLQMAQNKSSIYEQISGLNHCIDELTKKINDFKKKESKKEWLEQEYDDQKIMIKVYQLMIQTGINDVEELFDKGLINCNDLEIFQERITDAI